VDRIRRGLLLFANAWLAVQVVVPEGSTQYYAFTGLMVGLIALYVPRDISRHVVPRAMVGSDPRRVCPQCGRPPQIYSALVIATGDCPHAEGAFWVIGVTARNNNGPTLSYNASR